MRVEKPPAGRTLLPALLLALASGLAPIVAVHAGADPVERVEPTLPKGVQEKGGSLLRQLDGAEVVLVEGGTFRMGSTTREVASVDALARRFLLEVPAEALATEEPAHGVELPSFYLDRFEVTNAQYAQFVIITHRDPPSNSFGAEYNVWLHGSYPDIVKDHPVVNVGWEDAAAYCEWVEGRLPTEAEWEKGARGANGRVFPWGNHWDEGRSNRGRFNAEKKEWKGDGLDGHVNTAPVGSFPLGASPCGAEDMAGNALEWVQDRFDPEYYTGSPVESPTGPTEGEERVLRGGSWYYDPIRLRTTFRHHLDPEVRNAHTGFRCAQEIPPLPTAGE